MFTFIEFISIRAGDDEYAELQIMADPEAGKTIPAAGGVRKLRWRRKGTGKRGGLRVIYFVRYRPNQVWMLTVYAKARVENVPAHILKQLKEAFEHG